MKLILSLCILLSSHLILAQQQCQGEEYCLIIGHKQEINHVNRY